MREIKFRAWSGGQFPKMEDFVTIMDGKHWDCYHDCEIKGRAIMQYTGLKDKNGVEIYEGDILLVNDEYTEPITDDGRGPTEPSNHLAPVVYNSSCFGVDILETANWFSKGFYDFYNNFEDMGDTEVIGNIHENKELLK